MSYSIEIHSTKALKNLKFFFVKLTNNNSFLEFHLSQNEETAQETIFFWESKRSTRCVDLTVQNEGKNNIYKLNIPILSNKNVWNVAFDVTTHILMEIGGFVYLDNDKSSQLNLNEFFNWRRNFNIQAYNSNEINAILTLVAQGEEISIFGQFAPFTFNTNLAVELQEKENPFSEFEKRMIQLQNAMIDDDFSSAQKGTLTKKNGEKAAILMCLPHENTLFINEEIEFIVFVPTDTKDAIIVPSNQVRQILPSSCFFDENSFYINNDCIKNWDTEIIPKSRQLEVKNV